MGKTIGMLIALTFFSGCAKSDKYMNANEPLYKAALSHLTASDPRFLANVKSDIRALPVYGKRFDCVLFVNVGSKIIEGKDREYCFDKDTLNFSGEI